MKYLITLISLLCSILGTNAQSLQEYIEEAEANNPSIQAYEMRYNISREKVNESDWLPNTELGLGYFVSEPETRTGAQMARFSGRQMIPWFGTISARENLANSMAETDYLEYIIAKRRISLKVAQSYYKLYGIKARQVVLAENITLLETYETLALTAIEVSQASAVDVLRLQIRQNELKQESDVLQETFLSELANFKSLLNTDMDKPFQITKLLSLPKEDRVEVDSLLVNPELLRFDALYESVSKEELVNQKEQNPMFGLGLDYIPVQERPDMFFSDNGKDIIMPMISLSIPLFNTRNKSRTEQNEMRQQEIKLLKQERYNDLEAALARAISKRNEARIIHEMQVDNLRRAKNAEEILIKSYETGTVDFNDILDIQELQLKFQTAQINAIQSYYGQSMLINYLTN